MLITAFSNSVAISTMSPGLLFDCVVLFCLELAATSGNTISKE